MCAHYKFWLRLGFLKLSQFCNLRNNKKLSTFPFNLSHRFILCWIWIRSPPSTWYSKPTNSDNERYSTRHKQDPGISFWGRFLPVWQDNRCVILRKLFLLQNWWKAALIVEPLLLRFTGCIDRLNQLCCWIYPQHPLCCRGLMVTPLITFGSIKTRTWMPPLGSSASSMPRPSSSSPASFL